MKNSKQPAIKFQQHLIFAVEEAAGASTDQSNYTLLLEKPTMQVDGNLIETFKYRLENYLKLVRVQNSVLQGKPDLTDLENIRTGAAVDLCNAVCDLWRTFTSSSNKFRT